MGGAALDFREESTEIVGVVIADFSADFFYAQVGLVKQFAGFSNLELNEIGQGTASAPRGNACLNRKFCADEECSRYALVAFLCGSGF